MTEIGVRPKREVLGDPPSSEIDRVVALPNVPRKRRRYGGALLGGGALLLLLGGLRPGGWGPYQAQPGLAPPAQRRGSFFFPVRVAAARATASKNTITLP